MDGLFKSAMSLPSRPMHNTKGIPERFPERFPDRFPERFSDRIPDKILQRILQRILERILSKFSWIFFLENIFALQFHSLELRTLLIEGLEKALQKSFILILCPYCAVSVQIFSRYYAAIFPLLCSYYALVMHCAAASVVYH